MVKGAVGSGVLVTFLCGIATHDVLRQFGLGCEARQVSGDCRLVIWVSEAFSYHLESPEILLGSDLQIPCE